MFKKVLTYEREAGDVQEVKLNENQHGKDPDDVCHSVQEISVLMVDAMHINVNELHLEPNKERILKCLKQVKRHLPFNVGGYLTQC